MTAASRWEPDLPPGRTHRLAERGELFVRELPGPTGAPVVMLLHGWTATADLNWFATYRALGEHFRVIAFDHRGHGRGLRTNRRFRLADCADDAVAVADALGVDQFIPVGYSMGGAVASLLWRRRPARVDGLVLAATAATFFDTRVERARLGLLDPLSLMARALPAAQAQRLYERVVWSQTKDRNYTPWMVEEIRSCHARLVLEAGAELGRFDSRRWHHRIDVPVAVVVTTRDGLVPTPRQRQLAADIATAAVFEVEGDHVVCVAQPRLFVPQLVAACRHVAERRRVAT